MKTSESLLSIGKFIAEYSAHLMGAGVHTSRVVRNSKRIGEAFGLDVKLGVFHKNIILTIVDKETNEACNEVIDIPAHPISFEHNSELSALSWEAVDNHLSLEELTAKYKKIVSAPMIHPLFYHHRILSETADAEEKAESLHCFYRFSFCCFPLRFYSLDFRYNFRDSNGYQCTLSCSRCSFD